MPHFDVFWAFVLLGLFLLGGKLLKTKIPLLESLFLPSSIIAGFLVLSLGPQGIGLLAQYLWGGRLVGDVAPYWPQGIGRLVQYLWDSSHPLAAGVFPQSIYQVWGFLPGLLINVVFAALFLGKSIPGIRHIWMRAGPQVVFGQTLAWGQYVVGISLCLLILTPLFGISPLAGALIEISFEGGHGTAAGMAGTFRELGFEEGADLALGLATVGLVSGIVVGTVLINWAVRRGHINLAVTGRIDEAMISTAKPSEGLRRQEIVPSSAPISIYDLPSASGADGDTLEEMKELQWEKEQETKPTDPMSVHLGIVAMAIGIGWLLKEGLIAVESHTWGGDEGLTLIPYVPLFPLAMIGGVIIQIVADRTGLDQHISRRLMNRISGTALDFTIISALGTLSLTALGEHLVPFLALAVAGIAWNVLGIIFLAPRIIPLNWFERGIGCFGQSSGVTVTGLLLMRMADPRNETGAIEGFGYKQLLFEPVVGGGLFTAASLPLIAQFGPGFVLCLTAGVMTFWLIFGFTVFGRHVRAQKSA